MARIHIRDAKVIENNQRKVAAYLARHPCVDCGQTDIRVLEFDHVHGTKAGNVSRMIGEGYSWSTIEAEIAKCEVRCANCHRIRTSERGGFWHVLFRPLVFAVVFKEALMCNKKHCPGCNCDLDLDQFAWKNIAKGILQTWCRKCLKEANRIHYINNSQIYKDRAAKRNERVRASNKRKLYGYLSTHPCVDCGQTDIRCLEFDHVRGEKSEDISRMLQNLPWSAIEAEIVKCEVRCANCHRIKTLERGKWWRFGLVE